MSQERLIKEGAQGSSRFPAKNIIPVSAQKVDFETQSFEFYFNKTQDDGTLYVRTTTYHPGILAVPLSKLKELIDYLRTI